jgi:hypothetical protein
MSNTNSNTYWKSEFKLEILSKPGVSFEAFNASLDKFVEDLIDNIPDTGTAAPESSVDFWHGGASIPTFKKWSVDINGNPIGNDDDGDDGECASLSDEQMAAMESVFD